MKKILKRYGGLIAAGIALVVRVVFGSERVFETVFFQGWFPAVKALQSLLTPIWVIPGYYLMVIGLIFWLMWRFPRPWRSGRAWLGFFRRLINLLGGVVATFLVLWGYNYAGPDLEQRMNLPERTAEHEPAELYLTVMERAANLRADIPGVLDSLSVIDFQPPNDSAIVGSVRETLRSYGYPMVNTVRIRRITPPGALRRLGIAGIYNPFTGEANVDAVYGSVLGTFTAAHEVAHAFGITGEAEANFVAYLALIRLDDPMARYAAQYALWRYTAKTVNDLYSEEDRAKLAAAIPKGLFVDRRAIIERTMGYAPYFPELSDAVNDKYLKIQGVKAGVEDYDRFVILYLEWNAMTDSTE